MEEQVEQPVSILRLAVGDVVLLQARKEGTAIDRLIPRQDELEKEQKVCDWRGVRLVPVRPPHFTLLVADAAAAA